MDWWEMATLVGTLVATGVAGLALVWRLLESVRRDLGKRIEQVRQEGREAHEKIGEQIAQLRDGMSAETAQVRDGLGAEITKVGRGLAEVRGELKGVTRSVDTLREDFRAHVMAA